MTTSSPARKNLMSSLQAIAELEWKVVGGAEILLKGVLTLFVRLLADCVGLGVNLRHLHSESILESPPAKIVLVSSKDRLFDWLASAGCLALFKRMKLIEPLDKEQVG